MRRHLILTFCCLATVGSSISGARAADPFLSPPGVQERGLAGASVAGPGSVASVWHNPATLVDAGTRLDFEWQSAPDRARDGGLDTDSNSWLLGASFVNTDKWYGSAAIGIAAYTPHTKKFWVEPSGEPDSAFGRSNVTTQVLGVPYAVEFEELGLALGAVGELVAVDPSGSDIRIEGASGDVTTATFTDEQTTGFSGAMGFRYQVYDTGSSTIDLGGVWRVGATGGASVDVESGTAALLLPDKPGGYDLGLRWRLELSESRQFSTHVQYADTDWDSAGDIARQAIGVSLRTPFESLGPLRAGHRIISLGYSRATPDEAEPWMDWPEATAVSAAIAFVFSNDTHFDVMLEQRSEERDRFDDESSVFLGLGFGVGW